MIAHAWIILLIGLVWVCESSSQNMTAIPGGGVEGSFVSITCSYAAATPATVFRFQNGTSAIGGCNFAPFDIYNYTFSGTSCTMFIEELPSYAATTYICYIQSDPSIRAQVKIGFANESSASLSEGEDYGLVSSLSFAFTYTGDSALGITAKIQNTNGTVTINNCIWDFDALTYVYNYTCTCSNIISVKEQWVDFNASSTIYGYAGPSVMSTVIYFHGEPPGAEPPIGWIVGGCVIGACAIGGGVAGVYAYKNHKKKNAVQ